jgi:hypothetical protein
LYIYKVNYYGFIYIWYDRKHKMYYIGSHFGPIDDGYICGNKRMNNAYKKRPQDFKRRILYYHQCNDRQSLYDIEQCWLNMINEQKLNTNYYNLVKTAFGFDSETARKNAYILLKNNNHNSQKPEIVEKTRQKNIERVRRGTHQFLGPEMNRRCLEKGIHISQQPGFANKMSKIALERVKNKTHNLQGKENNKKLYEMNKHPFQQPEFIKKLPEQTRKHQKYLLENGIHISQKNIHVLTAVKTEKGQE